MRAAPVDRRTDTCGGVERVRGRRTCPVAVGACRTLRVRRPAGEEQDHAMIVRMAADGALVQDADDCDRLHVETDLDDDALAAALAATGTGVLDGPGHVRLDLGTLRSRARLASSDPGWADRWTALTVRAGREGRLSADELSVRVPVERPAPGGVTSTRPG
jgi:hypothetical protein